MHEVQPHSEWAGKCPIMMLNRIFGRKPFASLQAEADRLFGREEYGRAKLAYEKAADARDATKEGKALMRAQVARCCDAIARSRLSEAERLWEQGSADLAEEELFHAQETAVDEDLKRSIAERLETYRRKEYREQLQVPEALDEEARYVLLAGNWEESQALEYERYGEPFRQALLRLHDEHVQAAATARDFEALLADVEADAEYLWFEVGRARLRNDDRRGAGDALNTFIKRLGPGEGGQSRLLAHMTLAALATEQDDIEEALNCYSDAIEAMPDDPRPYLAMGSFMRQQNLHAEAVDVLQSALSVLADGEPHFLIWQELGIAYAGSDRPADAIEWLEKVVDFFASRQQLDLPPEGAVALAKLYEQQGNQGRAADLFKLLCAGSDRRNLLYYHVEAARLLEKLGAMEDARRFLARATELATEADNDANESNQSAGSEDLDQTRSQMTALRARLGLGAG